MVLAILVETTSPIRVLRRPGVFAVLVAAVVSARAYFFCVAAFLLAAFFAVTVFFTGLLALAAAPLPPASSFWRNTVCTRAMSFCSSRIFFRLSVCPIFIIEKELSHYAKPFNNLLWKLQLRIIRFNKTWMP